MIQVPSGDVDRERDAVLAQRCVVGDPDAFAELYRWYRARLLRLCLRRLGDPDEADDAVQETFVRAWRALAGFDGSWRVYPWLRTIAANVCTDVARRRRRVAVEELHDSDRWSTDPVEAHMAALDARRELVRLRPHLEELPERYRRTLVLHGVKGLSSRQIAVEHGTSVRAVETVLLRARRVLRTAMERPALALAGLVGHLATTRRGVRPLRQVGRTAASGALVTGAMVLATWTLVAPSDPGREPAPPPDRTSLVTPAGPVAASPPTTAPVVVRSAGTSPIPPPPTSAPPPPPAPSEAPAWHPAPGVAVSPAGPAARAAAQEPLVVSVLGVVAGTDPLAPAEQAVADADGYLGQVADAATGNR